MDNNIKLIKKLCKECAEGPKEYVIPQLKYIGAIMRVMSQEDLAEAINTLNIHELRRAIAAGVPGDCNRLAHALLRKHKQEMYAYLKKSGNVAHMTLDEAAQDEEDYFHEAYED